MPMYRLSFAVVMIALLCGCSGTDKSVVEEPIISSRSMATEATYTFQAAVAEHIPLFDFCVIETEMRDTDFYTYEYIIEISCPDLIDYTPQVIEVMSEARWNAEQRERYIDLIDIDFDGFTDLQVALGEEMANIHYSFYRWNVFVDRGYGKFEESPFFDLITVGYALYPDTKQIISTARDNAVKHSREMYQLRSTQNGGWLSNYEMIRREAEDPSPDDNGDVVARIFFEDTEIYKWNWLQDADNGHAAIADNYLRFGVSNPIDAETAKNLLLNEYGESDRETGFKFSFKFEEMILYKELSCYKFRIQWLVDDNHWSTIGFVGVTPNGDFFHESDLKIRSVSCPDHC